jgi:uncharacterized protein (TIGR03067 family)
MFTHPSLAVMIVAFAMSSADQKIAAPVPKDAPPPSIEGKYNLTSMSMPDRMNGPGGGPGVAGGGPGGFGGPVVGPVMLGGTILRPAYIVGPAVITRNEITLEGNGRVGPAGAGGPITLEYTLDPTKSPMAIDVETINVRGKKSKALGIVEVIGNRLILVLGKEGEERPKTTEENDSVTVFYFQKAPPPPKTEFRIVALTAGNSAAVEKELNKLAQDGYELVTTTQPLSTDGKSSPTTIHFLFKRTVRQ